MNNQRSATEPLTVGAARGIIHRAATTTEERKSGLPISLVHTEYINAPAAADQDYFSGASGLDFTSGTGKLAFTQADLAQTKTPQGQVLWLVLDAVEGPFNVTVTGLDKCGLAISEVIVTNGTTPVVGAVGFWEILTVTVSAASTAAKLLLGYGAAFGIDAPTLGNSILLEMVDGAVPGTAGVITKGQTAANKDNRGVYTPHSSVAPNGSRNYTIVYLASRADTFDTV